MGQAAGLDWIVVLILCRVGSYPGERSTSGPGFVSSRCRMWCRLQAIIMLIVLSLCRGGSYAGLEACCGPGKSHELAK